MVRTNIHMLAGLTIVSAMEYDSSPDEQARYLVKLSDGSVLVIGSRANYGYDSWPTLEDEITDDCQRALDANTP